MMIGGNRFWLEQGELRLKMAGNPWVLTGRGPRLIQGKRLEAEFTFVPRSAGAMTPRTFLSKAMTGEEHQWIIANPRCDVRGSVRFGSRNPGDPEMCVDHEIDLCGRGYHDHNYGTGPIGPGLANWIWGRLLLEDRALTFHHAMPRDRRLGEETHLLEADDSGLRDLGPLRVVADWSRKTNLWLRYPGELRFGDVLHLFEPRVIDSSPFYLRLTYSASFRGVRGQAFCEVAYPRRLLWPVLGRMIEMSIHRV